jgi:hypothetical protein
LPRGVQWITIRARDGARPAVESVLERDTKRWRLERVTPDGAGAVTLVYAVRCRKRMPFEQLLAGLRAAAGSQEFTVEAG